MKIAVCIATGGIDAHGYIRRYAEQFSEAAQIRGLEVEILRHPEPEFYTRLYENLLRKDCIVHFYGYLYDLKMHGRAEDGRPLSAIDTSNATTVATIGDHPFSTFMHSSVKNAHPSTKFIVMDKAFQDELRVLNPYLHNAQYDHQPISPPTNFDAARVREFAEREFDLVVPMYVPDMKGNDIGFVLSSLSGDWFIKVIEETYERSLDDHIRSPFHIFQECFQRHVGLTLSDVRDRNPSVFSQMTVTMAAVDGIVRQGRRQKMLKSLLRSVGNLKVAITCDLFSGLDIDDRVRFVGKRSVTDIADLMANSRAVLNCNPSYPSSLHERIVSGMMYGSCVVTDVNPYIADTFRPDEYIAYDSSSKMTIMDLYGSYDVAAFAAAGARKVSNDPAYSWDGHIDRLVHAAAA